MLWHAPRAERPRLLLDALAKRGFRVQGVDHAFRAMAEACMMRREGGRGVLLLSEPGLLAGWEPLVEALARYAPDTPIWVYEADAGVPLRALSRRPKALEPAESPGEVVVKENGRRRGPTAPGGGLRLAGSLEEGPSASDRESQPHRLLSDEELSMLLDE